MLFGTFMLPVTMHAAATKGIGGVEGDRTLDLRIANATLSQLSYHPVKRPQL